MAKLEDLLQAQGFTAEEIAANAAILNDPKLRGALESSYGKLEADLTTYKTENESWGKWHEEHGKPTLKLYEEDRANAVAEAAALRARLKLATEGGFAPAVPDPTTPAPVTTVPPAAFDPKAHNLVTQSDAANFAVTQGRAMAMYQDISSEHFRLFGKPLEDFSGVYESFIKRPNKEQSIKDLWEQKYNVQSKRDELAASQRKAAEDAIREDERTKMAAQYGNPNVREMMPSSSPFIPRVAEGESKFPWENDATAAKLRSNRLERAMQSQVKGVA